MNPDHHPTGHGVNHLYCHSYWGRRGCHNTEVGLSINQMPLWPLHCLSFSLSPSFKVWPTLGKPSIDSITRLSSNKSANNFAEASQKEFVLALMRSSRSKRGHHLAKITAKHRKKTIAIKTLRNCTAL